MERYCSVTEFAKFVGVNRSTVIRWVKDGKIKSIKPGRDYKILKSEVEKITQQIDQTEQVLQKEQKNDLTHMQGDLQQMTQEQQSNVTVLQMGVLEKISNNLGALKQLENNQFLLVELIEEIKNLSTLQKESIELQKQMLQSMNKTPQPESKKAPAKIKFSKEKEENTYLDKLRAPLQKMVESKETNVKALANEIGVNRQVLGRFLKGDVPKSENLSKIESWVKLQNLI